jgi:hypothetical protein
VCHGGQVPEHIREAEAKKLAQLEKERADVLAAIDGFVAMKQSS